MPATAQLVVVDLVPQHDEQSDEQLPGNGDFGFGASPPMHDREVGSLEVDIHPGGMRRGLPEDEAEERAALRSVLPCLVMWPRGYLSAEAFRAGARPT
jgi:hypothetical protein